MSEWLVFAALCNIAIGGANILIGSQPYNKVTGTLNLCAAALALVVAARLA